MRTWPTKQIATLVSSSLGEVELEARKGVVGCGCRESDSEEVRFLVWKCLGRGMLWQIRD